MTTYKTRIATAIATGSVLLHALAGMTFAATSITITGNGVDSNNTANVSQQSNTTVVQNNNANITNNVDVNSSTGGNDAKKNTGGNVNVDTGNATTNVTVSNTANQNSADVQNCGTCNGGDTTVKVAKNGAGSNNNVDLNNSNTVGVFQNNTANVNNTVDVSSKTGGNDASKNTGGDVSVTTGNTTTSVALSTNANANTAMVGGGNGSNGGGVSAIIKQNGADSDNDINLGFDSTMIVTQDNDANVKNKVDVEGSTGGNNANKNTGGNIDVDTGDADTDVTVDNTVNFNAADVSNCACIEDVTAEIDENGVDSDNNINAAFGFNEGETDGTFQNNDAHLNNKLDDVKSKTGYNDVNENTGDGEDDSDPSVTTGDTDSSTHVSNTANVNTFGDGADVELPDMDIHFSWNWMEMWGSFFNSH